MTSVADEIKKAIDTLGLDETDFRKIAEEDSGKLINEFIETFVDGGDRRWWWEAFKMEPVQSITPRQNPYKLLVSIVPDPCEKLWFVVEDHSLSHYPVYEGNARVVTEVIGECFGFEYYLILKNMQWLLCENHHSMLVGSGEEIVNGLIKHVT